MTSATAAVRKANAADASAIAHVYVQSWRATYPGVLPARVLQDMKEVRETLVWWKSLCGAKANEATFVAQDSQGPVVGFASAGPERGGSVAHRAELYTLYLLETHHRRGLGAALVAACAAQLSESGADSMVVWVLAQNRARGFYKTLGGTRHGNKMVLVGGKPVREVSYLWRDLESLVALARR